jgi:heat shock protein HslJ
MSIRSILPGLLLLVLVYLLQGCSQTVITQEPSFSITGSWQLIQINEQPVDWSDAQAKPGLTVSDDNRVSGFSGCNQFFGQLSIQGNQLVIEKMGMTRKMCLSSDMFIEDTISAVLPKWSSYQLTNSQLVLANGENRLVFRRVSDPSASR